MTYWLLKIVLTPILNFLYRIRVEGLDNVPADGPVILASNHVSFSDSIFLPLVLRRRVTFVAKAEYFENPKTAWFFRAVGQIPIKREGGSASQRALASAREVLDGGGVFGIYPEGTRSPDGRLYKGHTGVARLALQCRAPVLAVAMIGTREAQPIGQVKPRFFMPITVRFSEPMNFDRFYDRRDDALVLRQITDEIMWKLRDLSGQEYVNRYAKRGEAVEAVGPEPASVVAARRTAAVATEVVSEAAATAIPA
ncbi:MAG TPA: lysophospholipid acyltransferase family protein [Acidimicrobiales bacterium]|jgi:1-acyl-sn-glycerol-3-phosphate acyltransferase|nr:lysophospholipid acyltransferase family protein [Acidimicrobiales bacterium]